MKLNIPCRKRKSFLRHTVNRAKLNKSWNSVFRQEASWPALNPNIVCFLPKSNLRPFLGVHRSLWWPLQFQNKPCKTSIPNAQSKRSPCSYNAERTHRFNCFIILWFHCLNSSINVLTIIHAITLSVLSWKSVTS